MSSSWGEAVGAVLRRPTLWPVAVRLGVRATPRDWFRRAPFLPLPDRRYVRFRLETQYGTVGAPTAADVVAYLEWCRREDRGLHP